MIKVKVCMWRRVTGIIYDTTNGKSSDTCSGELCEASGGHCVLCYLLPDTNISDQLTW